MKVTTRITHTHHYNRIVADITQYTNLSEQEATILNIQAFGRLGGIVRSSQFLMLAGSTPTRLADTSKLHETFDAIKASVRPAWMIAGEHLSDVSIAFEIGVYDISGICTRAASLTILTQLLTRYHGIESIRDTSSLNCQPTLFQRYEHELVTPTNTEIMIPSNGVIGATISSAYRSVFAKELYMKLDKQYQPHSSKTRLQHKNIDGKFKGLELS